jgi:hypothetical protein
MSCELLDPPLAPAARCKTSEVLQNGFFVTNGQDCESVDNIGKTDGEVVCGQRAA